MKEKRLSKFQMFIFLLIFVVFILGFFKEGYRIILGWLLLLTLTHWIAYSHGFDKGEALKKRTK